MDDDQIWRFEEGLWTGDADHFRKLIDHECLMALPSPPFILAGSDAAEAVANTPRWHKVELSQRHVARPQEGILVIAYRAEAHKSDGQVYAAHCTSVLRRLEPGVWRVIQHQQTPPVVASARS